MNRLFSGFDAICERTGVEKIKTVGDAYLVIGGLDGGADHAAAIAETALQMIELVEATAGIGAGWRVRIGLHSGPAVAGVIGTTKFAYDVWGDTVNVAARLEGASEPNRIHLSGDAGGAAGGSLPADAARCRRAQGQGARRDLLPGRSPRRPEKSAGRPRRGGGQRSTDHAGQPGAAMGAGGAAGAAPAPVAGASSSARNSARSRSSSSFLGKRENVRPMPMSTATSPAA